LYGEGVYNPIKIYQKYNAEKYYNILQQIYKTSGSCALENGFPNIWNFDFIRIHNCIICSSVLIERSILEIINNFNTISAPGEDYDCWLRALQHTNAIYLQDICFYYDGMHGYGQNY
jgi:hypothetical protein